MSLASTLLLFKALHIIGAVAWFGGLFYLGRIFVYHAEAFDKSKLEQDVLLPQLGIMEERAYRIICNPAMMFTWSCGLIMLYLYGLDWFTANPWIHVKLLMLVILTVYQLYCKKYMKQLRSGTLALSSFQFRLFNEVPTLALFAIVLLAVFKNTLQFGIAFIGILLLGILFYFITKRYKRIRESK
jgi:putative membrane protein